MRQITSITELREILPKYEFVMYNEQNDYKGEITTLDETDINNIIYDMGLGSLSAKAYEYNGRIIVEYPNTVCLLESVKLKK